MSDQPNHYQWMVERAWTEQLYREYKHICFYYKVGLRPPLLEIADLGQRYGSWSSLDHKISLSRQLIRNQRWDVVIAILKHEMAHQIVSEIYGNDDEQHGPLFKRACDVLGIEGWASAADADLASKDYDQQPRVMSDEEERLLRKVEKLLSLATSGNENEAYLAMKTVQDLYRKYNIERIESKKSGNYETLILRFHKKRLEHHYTLIASLLTQFFFVEVIFCHEYNAKDMCDYKTLEILGARQNVLMAEYVFHFLLRRLQHEWDAYSFSNLLKGRRNRGDFFIGVIKGFEKKLKEQKSAQSVSSTGSNASGSDLVSLKDPYLQDYVQFKHPRITYKRSGGRSLNANIFRDGMQVGNKIVLSKALHGKSGSGSGTKLISS